MGGVMKHLWNPFRKVPLEEIFWSWELLRKWQDIGFHVAKHVRPKRSLAKLVYNTDSHKRKDIKRKSMNSFECGHIQSEKIGTN